MAILDYLKNLNPYTQIKKQYHEVKKELERIKRTTEPYSADYNYSGDVVPLYPYPLDTIYEVAYFSDVMGTVHRALRTQMFKNGYEVIKSEDTNASIVDEQEEGYDPKEEHRIRLIRFLKCCNNRNQDITEVLKELEDDLNIIDLYFCGFMYDYYINNGTLYRDLKEIIRIDPRTIRLVANVKRQFGVDDDGNRLSFSISNRAVLLKNKDVDKDGFPTLPAWYKQIRNGETIYYSPEEVVYSKRYRPAELLGFSPVVTLFQKIRTLQQQDKYILELYEGKRPPKGLLAFNTSNRSSLMEAWDEMLKKAKINPHLPAVLGITNQGNGKFAEFIDFMKSLDELQYTEQRDEYRRTIGAFYGVSPIFQGDMSTGGGLNNEGLQITVTNDAIQEGQQNYNQKLLKKIVKDLGCHGWSLLLKPSEEQDEMARLQRQELSLRNGEIASRLGLTVKYDSRQGEVVIEDGEIKNQPIQDDLFNPFEEDVQRPKEVQGVEPDNETS